MFGQGFDSPQLHFF